MFFRLNDVVKLRLYEVDFYVKIVKHKHSLGFISILADDQLSINIEVLKTYKDTEVICSVTDPAYRLLLDSLKSNKKQQLRIWEQMDAAGWNKHESFMHERMTSRN